MRLHCRHQSAAATAWSILFAVLSISNAAALSVSQPMTRASVAVGSTAALQCRFDPQPEYIIWNFAAGATADFKILTRCHLSQNSCSAISSSDFAAARVTPNGTMEIPRVDGRHNGTYTCDGLKMLDTVSTTGWLFVTAPPNQPVIDASRLQAAEGEQLVLDCVSAGANPPADLAWMFTSDGRSVLTEPGAEAQVLASKGFDKTESRLTLTARTKYDAARISCRALHPLANLSSEAVQLAVLYKPVLDPVGSVAVVLGSRIDLACSARGNPTPQVQLAKGSETLAGAAPASLTYSLIASSRSVAGVYRCAAQNSQGQSEQPFAVDVQYGPSVSCPSSVPVREGAPLQVDCLVDSNPGPISVTWRRVDSGVYFVRNSFRLRINSTTKADAGVWRCQAVNRLMPNNSVAMEMNGSADTSIIVEYPPGQPSVVISNRRVLRGDNISLVCMANSTSPGIPSPSFEWSRSTSATSASYPRTGPSLALAFVSLADAGAYSCTPFNSAGRGPPGVVQLEVEQAPDWLEAQPRPPVAVPMNSTAPESANPFRLVCSAVAKPRAEILWYKDGQAIDTAFYSVEPVTTFVDSSYYRTTSSLVFSGSRRAGRLRPEDNGRYLCEAKNTHGKVESVQELSVEFKPQILTTETTVALPSASPSGSANLTCVTIGQPMTALIWLRSGVPVPGGRQTADPLESYRAIGRLDGLKQPGSYSCRAENRLGSAEHTFRLVNASVPDAPTDLRTSGTADWDRVLLTWQPGFIGVSGEDAKAGVQYEVQISQRDRHDPNRIVMKTVLKADSFSYSNISGLLPDTNYSVAVYAVNRLGQGPSSQPLSLRTPTLDLPKPSRVRVEDGGILRVAALGGYCMKIESSEDAGQTWSMLHLCVASDKLMLPGVSTRLLYRVSLCLTQRPEVCGPAVLSTDGLAALPDVSTATIAIVGGCCAVLILLLSMVLLYFCFRRRRHYKEIEGASQHPLLLRRRQQQQQQLQQQQESPSEGSLQQGRYHTAPDGKPYALVPPHPSMSADNVTCLSGSRRSSSLVTSAIVAAKDQEASGDGDLGAGPGQPPARGGGVFATLRSGHNPLDSSASNPAIFNYSQDYPDDNRNTDPYSFESGYRQGRKIVYEVVV